MSDAELLPCPFCGGKADYTVTSDEGQRNDYDTVCCATCPAQMSALLAWHERSGERRKEMCDAWNTRADATEIAALQAQIDAERAKVAALVEALRVADVEIMENVSDSEFIRWAENVVCDIRAAIEAARGE